MSMESGKSAHSFSRDSESDNMVIDDRKSTGRKTVSEIVRADTAPRSGRKRGVIAPHAPLDTTRAIVDIKYDKYEKDDR